MAITEDYVSFETAKLLKEKGFSENTEHELWYVIKQFSTGCHWNSCTYKVGDITREYDEKYCIAMPTLQMTMKWLREKHNLSIEVYRTACGYIGCIVAIPSGTDIKFLEENGDDLSSGQYTKWEYACEDTIKYCLENLI